MILEKISSVIPGTWNQFTDVRYEEVHKAIITFDGNELTDIRSNISDGFNTRVFRNGAMASGSFAHLNDAPGVIKKLSDTALLISRLSKKKIT